MAPWPFVTRLITRLFGGFAWSRFGPTFPDVPASASVWHERAVRGEDRLAVRRFLSGDPRAGDGADVLRDVLDSLTLIVDAEPGTVDVVTRGEGLVDGGHARRSRRGVGDRELDLCRDDLGERVRRHPGLACLGECVVQIGPDRATRSGIGECVAPAAGLDEQLLARSLTARARVPTGAAPRERHRECGRARSCEEYDGPHGRRVYPRKVSRSGRTAVSA